MLEGMTPPKTQWPCAVRTVTESLDAKDAKILTDAINNLQEWPAHTLYRALQARGVLLSDNAITRHRTKRCSCGKMN